MPGGLPTGWARCALQPSVGRRPTLCRPRPPAPALCRNVLLSADGRACLSDLGLAQALGAGVRTAAGFSRLYAAPEQLMGQRCGLAADVYSFGLLLVSLLTREVMRERGAWRLPRAPEECPQVRRHAGCCRRACMPPCRGLPPAATHDATTRMLPPVPSAAFSCRLALPLRTGCCPMAARQEAQFPRLPPLACPSSSSACMLPFGPQDVVGLIGECLSADPAARPTAAQILARLRSAAS